MAGIGPSPRSSFAQLRECDLEGDIAAEGPTDKGAYTLSGSISFERTEEQPGSDSRTFQVDPGASYFVLNNVSLGLRTQYLRERGDDLKFTTYGAGPSLRLYVSALVVKPFVGASYFLSELSSIRKVAG
jgi:hypothetical protein